MTCDEIYDVGHVTRNKSSDGDATASMGVVKSFAFLSVDALRAATTPVVAIWDREEWCALSAQVRLYQSVTQIGWASEDHFGWFCKDSFELRV